MHKHGENNLSEKWKLQRKNHTNLQTQTKECRNLKLRNPQAIPNPQDKSSIEFHIKSKICRMNNSTTIPEKIKYENHSKGQPIKIFYYTIYYTYLCIVQVRYLINIFYLPTFPSNQSSKRVGNIYYKCNYQQY